MSISLRLPNEVEKRLDNLAKKTHRSKSYYAREAIIMHLEDLEDYYEAIEVLKNPGKKISLEEIIKENGLED